MTENRHLFACEAHKIPEGIEVGATLTTTFCPAPEGMRRALVTGVQIPASAAKNIRVTQVTVGIEVGWDIAQASEAELDANGNEQIVDPTSRVATAPGPGGSLLINFRRPLIWQLGMDVGVRFVLEKPGPFNFEAIALGDTNTDAISKAADLTDTALEIWHRYAPEAKASVEKMMEQEPAELSRDDLLELFEMRQRQAFIDGFGLGASFMAGMRKGTEGEGG